MISRSWWSIESVFPDTQYRGFPSDSLRGSSIKIGTIERRLAWPLRKDDTHKSQYCGFPPGIVRQDWNDARLGLQMTSRNSHHRLSAYLRVRSRCLDVFFRGAMSCGIFLPGPGGLKEQNVGSGKQNQANC